MSGSVIGKELNLGYAGTVSRSADAIITPKIIKSVIHEKKETAEPILFGEPVVLNNDNSYSRFGANGTATTFVGIAVREIKQATDYYSACGSYLPGEICDVLNRGSIMVRCNVGTPTAGGKVYIRTKGNVSVPNGVIGQFEAAADGSNTIEIPNLKWSNGKLDANKIAEVTVLTRTI